MGISILMLEWFKHLKPHDVFRDADMLEFGPQDLFASAAEMRKFLSSPALNECDPQKRQTLTTLYADDVIAGADQNSNSSNENVKDLYALLGAKSYESLDAYDVRANYVQDLNAEFDLGKTYSLITDFGTSEHCFNIHNSFRMLDRHLAVNGVALYVLPAFADINHGFWNVHPHVFTSFALANGYEILDFTYADDVNTREENYLNEGAGFVDFSTFPIQPLTGIDRAQVQKRYIVNCLQKISSRLSLDPSRIDLADFALKLEAMEYPELAVYDHSYVALRKIKNKVNFVTPYQMEYDISPYLNKIQNIPQDITEIFIAPAGNIARALVAQGLSNSHLKTIEFIDQYKAGTKICGCDVKSLDQVKESGIKHALIVHTNPKIVSHFEELFKTNGIELL